MGQAIDQDRRGPLSSLTRAEVVGVDGRSVRLRGPSFGQASAIVGVAGYAPQVGDLVLVSAADDGGRYVVGVVRALRAIEATSAGLDAAPRALRASDGASASLESGPDGEEVLALRDADGRLLVRHDPQRGVTEVCAPGNLQLRAAGDLDLDAEGAVRVRAGTDLDLSGAGTVSLSATDLDGAAQSHLTLREGLAQLIAERLGGKVDRADLSVKELNLVARTVRTVASRVKREVETLETQAERIVERTRESYRETEGLAQTRAGRLRMVAETSFSALAKKTLLKAREDVKIKGERIYLA